MGCDWKPAHAQKGWMHRVSAFGYVVYLQMDDCRTCNSRPNVWDILFARVSRHGRELSLLEVSGSSFQMGYQHGKQASVLIHAYLRWIEKLTGKNVAQLCGNAVRFLPFIQRFSPRYMEEVCGLAEGAGISIDQALLCQVRAEAARKWDGGCTSFALSGESTADGRPLAGQNQDLEPDYSDVSIVLKVRPNDGRPRAVMFTFAGQLGYAGMNEFGVCQFANALYDFKWQPGLSSYPVRRVLLEQRTVADCLNLLRNIRMCSALNFVLADGQGGIADVEVRPEGIRVSMMTSGIAGCTPITI